MKEPVEAVREKIGILEIGQHAQVDGDAERHEQLLPEFRLAAVNGLSDEKIDQCGKNEQQKEKTARFVIEEKADEKEIPVSERLLLVDDGINGERYRQEDPEIQPCEQQRSILVVKEYICQFFSHVQASGISDTKPHDGCSVPGGCRRPAATH